MLHLLLVSRGSFGIPSPQAHLPSPHPLQEPLGGRGGLAHPAEKGRKHLREGANKSNPHGMVMSQGMD